MVSLYTVMLGIWSSSYYGDNQWTSRICFVYFLIAIHSQLLASLIAMHSGPFTHQYGEFVNHLFLHLWLY